MGWWSGGDGSGGDTLILEFELPDVAVGGFHIVAPPEVERLVDAAALTIGIEIASFDYVAGAGDLMTRRDGDVAGRHPPVSVEEDKRDTPALVHRGHDERSRGDELELQLGSSGCGATGGVVAVGVLEDDAFGTAGAEFLKGPLLIFREDGGVDRPDRPASVEDPHQAVVTVDAGSLADVDTADFQQVEGVEGSAHGLAVDQAVHRQVASGFHDGLRQRHNEAAAVDAVDLLAGLADEHAPAVVLFLEDVAVISEQPEQFAPINRIEELRPNALSHPSSPVAR